LTEFHTETNILVILPINEQLLVLKAVRFCLQPFSFYQIKIKTGMKLLVLI